MAKAALEHVCVKVTPVHCLTAQFEPTQRNIDVLKQLGAVCSFSNSYHVPKQYTFIPHQTLTTIIYMTESTFETFLD